MTERVTATTKPYTIGRPPFRPGEDADFGGKFTEQPGDLNRPDPAKCSAQAVSDTHLRSHETVLDLVCLLLLEKKNYQVPLQYILST